MKDPTKNVENNNRQSYHKLKEQTRVLRGWLSQERAHLRRRTGAQVLSKALWWSTPIRPALRRQRQEDFWDFLVRNSLAESALQAQWEIVSQKIRWGNDWSVHGTLTPPYTCLCAHTDKRANHWERFPPSLPWNMYLNGKLLNLYPVTNKNGKPWWFVFLSKVLKEILFSGAWGRKG